MKAAFGTIRTHNPFEEARWASCLRENFTSSSYGEGLETGRALAQAPRQSLTRQETIRFMKQSYQLEDVRLLSYGRLRNLMALLTAVMYFTAVTLEIKLKLRVLSKHLVRAARRVFGVPDFRLYAIADGIKHILFNRSTRSGLCPRPPAPAPLQWLLFET
jgi:hypothetical protein